MESIIVVVCILVIMILLVPFIVNKVNETIRSVDRTNSKYLYKTAVLVLAEHELMDIKGRQYNLNKQSVVSEKNAIISEKEQLFLELFIVKYDKKIPRILTDMGCDYILCIDENSNIVIRDSKNRVMYPNPEEKYQ